MDFNEYDQDSEPSEGLWHTADIAFEYLIFTAFIILTIALMKKTVKENTVWVNIGLLAVYCWIGCGFAAELVTRSDEYRNGAWIALVLTTIILFSYYTKKYKNEQSKT